jgi:hypothetical protein
MKKREEILTTAQDRLRRQKEDLEKQIQADRARKRQLRDLKKGEDDLRRALDKVRCLRSDV